MDKVTAYNEQDAFSRYCGVEVFEIGQGSAHGRLTVQPHHLNGVGIVHGAAIFALADAVFAAASNSYDYVAVAINVSISYLKPTKEGVLYAQAVENNQRGRIGSYTVTISDQADQTVALFEGLAYRKF